VAPIAVHGRDQPYHWGFWVQVARSDFEEYLRYFDDDPPGDHPGFRATIANQSALVAPTLGVPVHVRLGSGTDRPRLMLLDDRHPLTRQQAESVDGEVVHTWSAACSPEGRGPEPRSTARIPTLEVDGWTVALPHQVGKAVARLDAPPGIGDLLKASFVFKAAGPHGEVTDRVEHMWVRLDHVGEDGWWSGTLDNHPFVPGPLDVGTRVWLRAEHVLDAQRGDAQAEERSAPARRFLGRWLRRGRR